MIPASMHFRTRGCMEGAEFADPSASHFATRRMLQVVDSAASGGVRVELKATSFVA